MSNNIYVGSAKAIQTKNGGLLKLSFSEKDLQTLIDNKNEAGYVNLVLSKRKEVSQYGQTHTCKIDTWKPDQAKTLASQTEPNKFDDFNDDVPF